MDINPPDHVGHPVKERKMRSKINKKTKGRNGKRHFPGANVEVFLESSSSQSVTGDLGCDALGKEQYIVYSLAF